jgi:hypothetical protein
MVILGLSIVSAALLAQLIWLVGIRNWTQLKADAEMGGAYLRSALATREKIVVNRIHAKASTILANAKARAAKLEGEVKASVEKEIAAIEADIKSIL